MHSKAIVAGTAKLFVDACSLQQLPRRLVLKAFIAFALSLLSKQVAPSKKSTATNGKLCSVFARIGHAPHALACRHELA